MFEKVWQDYMPPLAQPSAVWVHEWRDAALLQPFAASDLLHYGDARALARPGGTAGR
ncbi:MAG: hypothetical protein GDA49_08365 [Rhodospirillales bacterium]|nr:hypothetical protein [Rhodospirillales bacterium]